MTLDTDLETGPLALLDDYQPGESFFFASPRGALLADGIDAVVPKTPGCTSQQTLPRRVADFLRHAEDFGHRNPRVVGAVPFDESLPAHLVLPTSVRRTEPFDGHSAPPAGTAQPTRATAVRSVPDPSEYERGVRRLIERFDTGELDKVVLARSMDVECADQVDVATILRNLALRDPSGYSFAVDLPRRGEDGTQPQVGPRPTLGRTLVGASPELLVSRRGTQVSTNPLAGSVPRAADPVEDQRRGRELLGSDKDQREHASVVEAVADALRPLCRELRVPEQPSLAGTAGMWHLSTEVEGQLRDPDIGSLDLAVALHPTPAVCGVPVSVARAAIRETEPFERGFYTGLVGWSDSSGDGEWVVTIRCGEIEDRALRLYAGAGLVRGSRPETELAETSAKFGTALRAMGLDELV